METRLSVAEVLTWILLQQSVYSSALPQAHSHTPFHSSVYLAALEVVGMEPGNEAIPT